MKERREQRRKKEESYAIKQTKFHNNLNVCFAVKFIGQPQQRKREYVQHVHCLVCARVSEVVSLLPSHPSLLSALPSVLQHATSMSGELPPELQTVQSELRQLEEEMEKEKQKKEGDGRPFQSVNRLSMDR